MKKCIVCEVELEVDVNWHGFNAKKGYCICKECYRVQDRTRRKKEEHPEKLNAVCSTCKARLVVGKNWNLANASRRRFTCKDCLNKRRRERYKENPPKKIICKGCGNERSLHGKGYCSECYFKEGLAPLVVCIACGETKQHRAKGMCTKCFQRKQYLDNCEVIKARSNKYYYEHQDEQRKKNNEYYWKHLEEHRERRRAQGRRWKKNNPEKVREDGRKRRAMLRDATYEPVDIQSIYELYKSCIYCGSKERLTIDHVLPLFNGGKHVESNLVVACLSCNSSKKDKPLEEWLQTQPYSQAWVM